MIDEKRIADFFAELVSIDSPSLEEREMADTLKIKFAEIGGYAYRRSYAGADRFECGQSVCTYPGQY